MIANLRSLAGAMVVGCTLFAGTARAADKPKVEPRPVDLVLCLDTSGSMDGLIASAKKKLWDITNELGKAKPTPRLRVALLTYGNDSHPAEMGWVRIDSAFTEDLDMVYKKLFALTTNGGTELVGRVIRTSLDKLEWSKEKDALQLIFVAGNEGADQDKQVDVRSVCRDAYGRGIVVNPIYCGNAEDGISPGWREIATLAGGHFASIDMNKGTISIPTPYDEEIGKLGTGLNGTYIPIGRAGGEGKENQEAQDKNAAGAGEGSNAARQAAKASELYKCRWDLVDRCKEEAFDITKVANDDLPENMRKMSVDERKAYVKSMEEKRAGIQKQIAELHAKRQAFIAEELKKSGKSEEAAFDAAVRKAIQEQATKKGFGFEK